MKLCFLVGSMSISGGTYVIIQHASYLREQGFEVTLAIQEPFSPSTYAWHDKAALLRCVPIESAKTESFDLVIATWWKTAFELGQFDARHYAYFVQSIESRFYPEDEGPLRTLVQASYGFPVAYITEARWIRDYLREQCGQTAALVRNGIRKDIYRTEGPAIAPRIDHQPRVLIEGHFGVSFKNTALALRLARDAGAEDIWVLTGSAVRWIPGASRVFSKVPMVQTADIYRSCDILIKLSTVEGMFGPPLEMFHCGGTAVVYDVTGHDEYIVNGVNACVVARGDSQAVVENISALLNDGPRLKALQQGARETASQWPSWEASSAEFLQAVQNISGMASVHPSILRELTAQAFASYGQDERARLHQNPRIVRRHKLSALASRLPGRLVRMTKQLDAVREVVFCDRKTY